jgi:Pyridoxamine 5'-phosphate oxidase
VKDQMDRRAHIERARELLKTARHAAMATVNEDGTPHNTPFMFLYEPDLSRIYWGSHPHSIHSKNIVRTGEVFFVWFDATERGGLYIKAKNAHSLSGPELEAALMIHNRVRATRGQDLLKLSYYTGDRPQRMWSATPTNFWVNGAIRDEEGHMAEDIREEVTVNDLI